VVVHRWCLSTFVVYLVMVGHSGDIGRGRRSQVHRM
jgi:hypothetical protein